MRAGNRRGPGADLVEEGGGGRRVALGSDHAGFEGRRAVREFLTEQGVEVLDLGPEAKESVDYPDFAHRVAEEVVAGHVDFGVLVCGTGQGMAMSANRHPGVRAAVVTDELTARMARAHNDANVACFGERVIGVEAIAPLLKIFLEEPFEGDRHTPRVAKIER